MSQASSGASGLGTECEQPTLDRAQFLGSGVLNIRHPTLSASERRPSPRRRARSTVLIQTWLHPTRSSVQNSQIELLCAAWCTVWQRVPVAHEKPGVHNHSNLSVITDTRSGSLWPARDLLGSSNLHNTSVAGEAFAPLCNRHSKISRLAPPTFARAPNHCLMRDTTFRIRRATTRAQ